MSRWMVEARRRLSDAEEDLRVARDLLSLAHYASSCFHSQQAAEKAVKAALYSLSVEARGRSTLELLRLLSVRINTDTTGLEDEARLLDKHYSPPRYPNLHPGIEVPAYELYSRGDAESCLNAAVKIMGFIKGLLKGLSST